MSNWDQSEHIGWGYLEDGRWVPTVDKRSAVNLVGDNPKRQLASRTIGQVHPVEEKPKES